MKLENIKNVCMKCGAACCKWEGPRVTAKERAKILKADFPDYFIENGRGLYDMKTKRGICPYLKNRLCSIQKLKPLACLDWPLLPRIVKGRRKYFVGICPLTPYLSAKDLKKLKKLAEKEPTNLLKLNIQWRFPSAKRRFKKIKLIPYEKHMKRMR